MQLFEGELVDGPAGLLATACPEPARSCWGVGRRRASAGMSGVGPQCVGRLGASAAGSDELLHFSRGLLVLVRA